MKLAFGTGSRFGSLSTRYARDLVAYALNKGIREFDTGYSYGDFNSQPLLALCLSDRIKNDRESLILSTKVGPRSRKTNLGSHFEPRYIQSCINESLSAFNSTYIDILYLHGPSIKDFTSDLFATIVPFLRSGQIKSLGVNTHSGEVMSHLVDMQYDFFSSVMIDFNLVQQDRAHYVNKLAALGMRVSAGTPFCQGLLIASPLKVFLRSKSLFYLARHLLKPSSREFIVPCSHARRILRQYPVWDPAALSLKFLLSNPNVSSVPVGMLSRSSISANVSACDLPIPLSVIHEVANKIKLNIEADCND